LSAATRADDPELQQSCIELENVLHLLNEAVAAAESPATLVDCVKRLLVLACAGAGKTMIFAKGRSAIVQLVEGGEYRFPNRPAVGKTIEGLLHHPYFFEKIAAGCATGDMAFEFGGLRLGQFAVRKKHYFIFVAFHRSVLRQHVA
ncbi:MAG: hypothetical protein AAF492_17220, partial [Verrucomicrobiota bacterium]